MKHLWPYPKSFVSHQQITSTRCG